MRIPDAHLQAIARYAAARSTSHASVEILRDGVLVTLPDAGKPLAERARAVVQHRTEVRLRDVHGIRIQGGADLRDAIIADLVSIGCVVNDPPRCEPCPACAPGHEHRADYTGGCAAFRGRDVLADLVADLVEARAAAKTETAS